MSNPGAVFAASPVSSNAPSPPERTTRPVARWSRIHSFLQSPPRILGVLALNCRALSPIEHPEHSFAPHSPIDDKLKLMPKRKNQDTADVMSAPAKKTKATKKKGAEEGTYDCFNYSPKSVRTHRGTGPESVT